MEILGERVDLRDTFGRLTSIHVIPLCTKTIRHLVTINRCRVEEIQRNRVCSQRYFSVRTRRERTWYFGWNFFFLKNWGVENDPVRPDCYSLLFVFATRFLYACTELVGRINLFLRHIRINDPIYVVVVVKRFDHVFQNRCWRILILENETVLFRF